ncbi:phage tail protein [Enterococcus cecorum]|uniref:phage tail protein n=1 Tax=Enterococcus cecorum TaxID=44008 RepID=UPI002ACAE919|nr:phage tail protein [Enterococcus cecorum]MDZ5548481.1 phage tail protein [Enterococcus cecorum]MDZ5594433.1 phage tail protein [Enterococcus cecorum]
MATELGQAYVQIMPSAKGISGMIQKQIEPESKSAGASAGISLGKSMITAVTAAIAAAGIGKMFAKSISEGAALEQSLGGVETLFKSSADTVKNYANQAYRTAGVSANKYMENVTSFSASLISSLGGDTAKAAELANTAMADMSDNANKMGTDMESITQTYQSLARGNYAMLDNLKLGYGGTKSEMERLMADAEKLTGEHYTVGDFADTVKAIHAVQDSLGITGTTAKEAATTLSGSLASMKAAFGDVLGKLSLGQDIVPSLNALAETTATFLFGNFIPMVGNILKGLPTAITTFISAAIPQMTAGLQSIFSDIGVGIDFSRLTSKFSGIITAIQPIINGLKTAFGQLPSLFNSVVSSVTPVINTLVSGFSRLDFSGIQTLISSIIPAIQTGFSAMMSIVGPAIDSVVNSFVSMWNAAQPLISVISGALMPAFQILGSFLGGVIKGALTGISMAFDAVKIAIEFLTPIITIVVNAFSALSPILSTIAQWVGTVIGLFGNLGVAGQGLSTFIKSAWTNIQTAISTAASIIGTVIEYIKLAFSGAGSAAQAVKNIISIVWMAIGDVIRTVSSAIRSTMSAAGNAFRSFGSVVSAISGTIKGVINGVKNTFNSLKNISLVGAGSAIMNGFLGGLQAGFNKVKGFVGGIASWIREHKGPISYDRKLLIPAGNAIMQGLDEGLTAQFKTVQSNVLGMADTLANTFNPDLNAELSAVGDVQLAVLSKGLYDSSSQQSNKESYLMDLLVKMANRPVIIENKMDGKKIGQMVAEPVTDEQNKRQAILNAVYGLGW